MQVVHSELQDKLSNLDSTLIGIERCEGADYDASKFEPVRAAILKIVGNFCHTRYELGRILAIYRELFKRDQVWMEAKKAIAKVIHFDPRHIDRIIKAVENAGQLTPIEIAALAKMEIDPGMPRNLPVVEAVTSLPRAATQGEADAAAEFAVHGQRANRKVIATPNSESPIVFARRAVKIFLGQFEHQPSAKRNPRLKYVFEMIIAAIHCDAPDLHKYSCMRDVPPPK